jgi:hypothetical protein
MNQYKTLMHALMVFIQCSLLTLAAIQLFVDVPYWWTIASMLFSFLNLYIIYIFQKGMKILPDNESLKK